MSFYLPLDIDELARVSREISGLLQPNLYGLSTSEARDELANRGERIIDEDQAVAERARKRRRGKNNGTSNFNPPASTASASTSSSNRSDNSDIRPNRFQRRNLSGGVR